MKATLEEMARAADLVADAVEQLPLSCSIAILAEELVREICTAAPEYRAGFLGRVIEQLPRIFEEVEQQQMQILRDLPCEGSA